MKKFSLILFFSIMVLKAQITDHKKAPNSYIFDVVMAKTNHYDGIRIPVKKAYDMWSNSQYLKTVLAQQFLQERNRHLSFGKIHPGLFLKWRLKKQLYPRIHK